MRSRRTLGRVDMSGPNAGGLTHVDSSGAARMVDVSSKDVTVRSAQAAGRVRTTAEVVGLLRRDALPKGDALAVARLAGIMGAKRTPDLIPLCHPIALHAVDVIVEVGESSVDITATVRTADRTGVEMEALTAVATAGLAVIDMIKAVDPAASIDDIRVLRKEGGKTGLWEREAHR
jgi:cyclic pyranopterin phosphate synthase